MKIPIDVNIPEETKNIFFKFNKKINEGTIVQKNQLIAYYSFNNDIYDRQIIAPVSGKIVNVNQDFKNWKQNKTFFYIEECEHLIVYSGQCSDCFEKVQSKDKGYKIFDKISSITAKGNIMNEKMQEILNSNKLIMILDLDNTIVHAMTTNQDQIKKFDFQSNQQVHQGQIDDFHFVFKFRPFLIQFLKIVSQYYEIFVYTFGIRTYAEYLLNNIDPQEIYLKVYQKEKQINYQG